MILFGFVLAIILVVAILLWFYLFNIYEVKIEVSENYLIANSNSEIEIKAVPLNSFGREVPFREVKAEFQITKGDSLIEVQSVSFNRIVLKEIGERGEVEVLVKSKLGLFPSKVKIEIKDVSRKGR